MSEQIKLELQRWHGGRRFVASTVIDVDEVLRLGVAIGFAVEEAVAGMQRLIDLEIAGKKP